jgi:hypothetical protein
MQNQACVNTARMSCRTSVICLSPTFVFSDKLRLLKEPKLVWTVDCGLYRGNLKNIQRNDNKIPQKNDNKKRQILSGKLHQRSNKN